MIDHQKDLLRRALLLYAGEHVLSRVLDEGEAFLSRHAKSTEVTMLFYDVAWFKEVPGVDAASLTDWGNALAEVATTTVKNDGGTFNTFVGDAGSAWWSGSAGQHAEKAVTCARHLVASVGRLNEVAPASRYPITGLMIGIHTGTVALGNFGSMTRLRYCPMGDAVNLASRLCSLASKYSVPIALSAATYSHLRNAASAKLLDRVPVKGSDEPMAIYGLEA